MIQQFCRTDSSSHLVKEDLTSFCHDHEEVESEPPESESTISEEILFSNDTSTSTNKISDSNDMSTTTSDSCNCQCCSKIDTSYHPLEVDNSKKPVVLQYTAW